MLRISLTLVLTLLAGCASSDAPPDLTRRPQLQFNTGQRVRVAGIARYSRVTGPSVVGEDFELRVYPRDAWGPELDGHRVAVTGTLRDATGGNAPDPSVLPGEYWLEGTKLDTRSKP